MPKQKDFKRLVRTRMQKTGESYTTARTQLLHKRPENRVRAIRSRRTSQPAIDVSLAPMSDATIRAKTGKSWAEWVELLDAIGAASMSHRDIAKHVYETGGISEWWSQSVTVGYERIRGLRDVGQRRGGSYEANKSKTLPVPLATLYRYFSDAKTRARWMPGVALKIRKATPEKSLRITWEDGSDVQIFFVAKGAGKSLVAIQHGKLASKESVAAQKSFWAERLAVLESKVSRATTPRRAAKKR